MMAATGTNEADALGPVAGLVLNLAPELGRWLFGPNSAAVVAAVQRAATLATGGSEPGQQAEALADPEKASALRLALARIAAEQGADASVQERTALLASLAAGAGGRTGAGPNGGGTSYGAPLVSLVVLLTFAVVMLVALTRSMPQGAEPVLNVLLGTLGAMATSVVGYWVGSSAGSARKEERLASLAERN